MISLQQCNLISAVLQEQLEALMSGAGARSEMDGITWAGFAEYYRRQEEEAKTLSSDANKVAEIKGQTGLKTTVRFMNLILTCIMVVCGNRHEREKICAADP